MEKVTIRRENKMKKKVIALALTACMVPVGSGVDVMAVGVSSAVAGNDGTVSRANGTSFASPTFCGLVACFWQACPWLTAKEVIEAVHRSADRADAPDNIYGYGVSNIWKAYQTELKKRK